MTLFDKFTRLFGKEKDARIAELESALAAEKESGLQLLQDQEFRDGRIAKLEADLAPFLEYVVANDDVGGNDTAGGGDGAGEAEADPSPAETG